jgi:hypothetical protein
VNIFEAQLKTKKMKSFIFKFDLDTAHIISEWAVYESEGYYCDDCRAFVPGDFEAELLDYEISPIDEADEFYYEEIVLKIWANWN